METDRDLDIKILEIEERNIKLIEEYYLSRMRPRDQEQLFQQQEQDGLQDSQRQISLNNQPV